jgi:hypothetical protein
MSVRLTTDSTADLREIALMRSARLGGALAGGVEAADLEPGDDGDPVRTRLGAALLDTLVEDLLDRGFAIPAEARDRLRPFDADADNRLSRGEFDKIPADGQKRIRDAIREKVRAAVTPGPK